MNVSALDVGLVPALVVTVASTAPFGSLGASARITRPPIARNIGDRFVPKFTDRTCVSRLPWMITIENEFPLLGVTPLTAGSEAVVVVVVVVALVRVVVEVAVPVVVVVV